jgi:hypothetical protein
MNYYCIIDDRLFVLLKNPRNFLTYLEERDSALSRRKKMLLIRFIFVVDRSFMIYSFMLPQVQDTWEI